jgi:hypothetical protein
MSTDTLPSVGPVRFERVFHTDSLTGENDHFGCLLTDAEGRVVRENGSQTWLYSGSNSAEGWDSRIRQFDLASHKCGATTRILYPQTDEQWATVHLVIQVFPAVCVAFYSTGRDIRAATAIRPTGPFLRCRDFCIESTEPWEDGSLEIDGGFVPISQKDGVFRAWLLYDNLGKGTSGQNGWAEVEIDRARGDVHLLGKHPGNPLPLLLPGRLAARTGGNLDGTVRIGGEYPLFYLSKPARREYRMGVALSPDPLFQTVSANVELEGCLGRETFIEKQQFYMHDGLLNVIYEAGLSKTDIRTGLRQYRLHEG